MQITADYDPKRVEQYLVQRAAATGRSMGAMMRREMALLVKAGMQSLPPVVTVGRPSFAGQKAAGTRAVKRDIGKVYARPRSAFEAIRDSGSEDGAELAKAFWKSLSGGRYAEALAFLKKVSPAGFARVENIGALDPAYHRGARAAGRKGRVPPRYVPRQIVTPAGGLTEYQRETAAKVGAMKGGFADAALRLGARGVPAWVSQHGTPGTLKDLTKNPKDPEIVATNLAEGSGAHDDLLKIGLRNREQRLKRETEAALRGVWR